MDVKKCKRCGKEFVPKVAPQRYCSDYCREYNSMKDRICPVCGKAFRSRKAKTCSMDCQKVQETRTKREFGYPYGYGSYIPKQDMSKYHSDSLDMKARIWGKDYGKYQASLTLLEVGAVDVDGIMRELGK